MRRAAVLLACALLPAITVAREPALIALDDAQSAAFAARLEDAVAARLRLLPAADAPLQQAAARCASQITALRVSACRDAHPRIIGLPGGRVFVSTGLLAAAESDAELVSAIAHEAGHVQREDLLDRLTKAYGVARLAGIASGTQRDVLAGMAANIAAGGLMTRHGGLSEDGAEDAARRAGCEGGLARILARAASQGRTRRNDRQAHPLPATARAFPGALDGGVELLQRVREAAGPLP